jgi:hypothetical protein
MAYRGFQEQKADSIGYHDFEGLDFFAVANVDSKHLDVIVQVFSAIHPTKVESGVCPLNFQDGIVFSDTRYVGEEVELNEIPVDGLLISERISFVRLVSERFREQRFDLIDGLALARLGAQHDIDIEAHRVAGLRIARKLFEERHPAATNDSVDAFFF